MTLDKILFGILLFFLCSLQILLCIYIFSSFVPVLLSSTSLDYAQHYLFLSSFYENKTWPITPDIYIILNDRIICWQNYLKHFAAKAYVFFFPGCHMVSLLALSSSILFETSLLYSKTKMTNSLKNINSF